VCLRSSPPCSARACAIDAVLPASQLLFSSPRSQIRVATRTHIRHAKSEARTGRRITPTRSISFSSTAIVSSGAGSKSATGGSHRLRDRQRVFAPWSRPVRGNEESRNYCHLPRPAQSIPSRKQFALNYAAISIRCLPYLFRHDSKTSPAKLTHEPPGFNVCVNSSQHCFALQIPTEESSIALPLTHYSLRRSSQSAINNNCRWSRWRLSIP
jgi:hypothetical protein